MSPFQIESKPLLCPRVWEWTEVPCPHSTGDRAMSPHLKTDVLCPRLWNGQAAAGEQGDLTGPIARIAYLTVENLNTVDVSYSSPGCKMVDGKLGWFGLSG